MGLNERTAGSGGNILVVKRGALCLESSDPVDGYDHVTGEVDGRPYEKWIKKFGSVDGMITDVKWYDTAEEYETRYQGLKINIVDGDANYIIDLSYASKSYDAFTRFAENIDFSQPIVFIAKPDKGSQSTAFYALQGGEVVRQKYTKNNLGACPPAVQNKRTGMWNFDDQREWLLDNLIENVVPKSGDNSAAEPKGMAAAAASEDRWAHVEDAIHAD